MAFSDYKSDVISDVCNALLSNDQSRATVLLRNEYPPNCYIPTERSFTAIDCMRVFWRDGFTDRYSGQRLIFPGTLRLLSILLPAEFPFHPHWRMDLTHPAFWELFPTIDHEKPVARGGLDDESNWVTTSQLRNSAKANWTLEELGWQKRPPGNRRDWDGLTSWFMAFVENRKELIRHPYLRLWHRACATLLQEGGMG